MTAISAISTLNSAHKQHPQNASQHWLDRVDRNGRRFLTLHIAPAMKALADLSREGHIGFPGAWQAASTFFYTANILVIPAMAEKLRSCIKHLTAEPSWSALKLHNLTNLFQSSLILIASTFFTATGLKNIFQLPCYAANPIERVLNAMLPWIRIASRVTAIFQIHDLVTGSRFRAKIDEIMKKAIYYRDDKLILCDKALTIIERYLHYLESCREYPILISQEIIRMRTQLKNYLDNHFTNEEVSLFSHKIVKLASTLRQISQRHTHYQTGGLLANCLISITAVMANSIAVSILTCGVSASQILREILWKKNNS